MSSFLDYTWTTGEDVTSPKLNRGIRANMRVQWHELFYGEFTANVAATTGGADVVTSGALTYLALPTLVEFYAPSIAATAKIRLYDGATNLGDLTVLPAALKPEVMVCRRLTPIAGSHTYKIVAQGSGNVFAGAGGAGLPFPGFLRIAQRGGV